MADGPNVGYATLSLIPSMKGSESILARESAKAGKASGGLFQSSFAKTVKSHLGLAAGAGIAAGVAAAGVGLFKLGDAFDEQFDRIRVSSGKTGADLAGLQDVFKDVLRTTATGFGGAGSAVSVLNQRLGLTGKPLEALSKQIIDLSRITDTDLTGNLDSLSDVFKNFRVDAIDEAPAFLDELFRASQASGVSISDLAASMADSGAVLRSSGLNFHASAALLASLGKAGLSASDVLPALSRNLKEAAKAGKAPDKVLASIFKRIQNAKPGAEAIGIAIEAFGAKGGKMADLIKSGALSVDKLNDAISNGKDTIGKATADTADFSEKFQILKNKVLVGLEPIATKAFDAVGRGLDIVSAWWTQNGPGVQEWFSNFGSSLRDTIAPAVDAVWNALKDHLLPKLAEFGTWLSDHQGAMQAFAGIMFVIGAGALFATSPFLLMIVVLATLAAGIAWAYDNWGWFKTVVDDVVRGMPTLVDALGKVITVLKDGVELLGRFGELFGEIPGFLGIGGNTGLGKKVKAAEAKGKGKPIQGGLGAILDGARAKGGPIGPGLWLVGENGPEILSSDRSGMVTPLRSGSLAARASSEYEGGWASAGHGVGDVILDGKKVGVALRKRGSTGSVGKAA